MCRLPQICGFPRLLSVQWIAVQDVGFGGTASTSAKRLHASNITAKMGISFGKFALYILIHDRRELLLKKLPSYEKRQDLAGQGDEQVG